MITLNPQLAQELGLTYWQTDEPSTAVIYQLNHEEKELLRKILQAKAIRLTDDMIMVEKGNVAHVTTKTYQLVFNNVSQADAGKTIHLAKLSEMLKDNELKKLTWHKLKKLSFY